MASIDKQLNNARAASSQIKPFSRNFELDAQLRNVSQNIDFSEQSERLGKDANIVAKSQKNAKYEQFRELAYAQSLLIQHDIKSKRSGNNHRTRLCHAARTHVAESISLNVTSSSSPINKASLSGLQNCGSVWSCPVCAKRIAVQRGLEIGYTIDEMYKLGFVPVMITLTASHSLADRLVVFKERFKEAWRSFSQSGTWQRLKKSLEIQHSIKAVEVTRTDENGWHYHQHGLLFIHADILKKLDDSELENWQDKVKKLWLSCLKNAGLKGDYDHACHISADGNIKENYLAKLGLSDETTNADYELTSGHNKDYKGRNIWSILRSAKDGDESDADLYIEYVQAMSGDNWITYSQGLKDLVNLAEMDEQEASETENDGLIFEKLMDITDSEYYFVRRTRAYAELLEVAAASRSVDRVKDFLRTLESDYIATYAQSDHERMKRQYEELDKQISTWRESYNKKAHETYKSGKSWTIDFDEYMPEGKEKLRKWRELRERLNIK